MRALVRRASRGPSGPSHRTSEKKKAQTLADIATRSSALATNRCTVGVSFAGSAFQSNYYETKFTRRASLLHALLVDLKLSFDVESSSSLLLASSSHARRSSVCQVASFGGGPGTDAAGLVTLRRESLWYQDQVSRFDVTLYDVEPSWKKYLRTLSGHFGAHVTLAFKPCNVTQGMLLNAEDGPAESETDDVIQLSTQKGEVTDDYTKYRRKVYGQNHHVDVSCTDLLLFFYVCHETSVLSKSRGEWQFYRDLALRAKTGAVVVMADVMGSSAEVLKTILGVMTSVRPVKILTFKGRYQAEVLAFELLAFV